ncbi:hypothetical protein HYX12_03450 [Candidatus Woesearchaeota archaeon]|nr:hypothetical protein [Candidatus Woesearchaeota archaeon]
MVDLFSTADYLQDKQFGGAKYAGLRGLQRLGVVDTIDDIFSPGFEVYDRLVSGELGQWIAEAYQHRDTIMDAYASVIKEESFDFERVRKAYAFFKTKYFSERTLEKLLMHKLSEYISHERDLLKMVSEFINTEGNGYLCRSSADIEDEEADTAGLFKTTMMFAELNDLESRAHDLTVFYGYNLAISIFRGRPARLNFVLCEYLGEDAGGVGFSYSPAGTYYLEVGQQAIKICQEGQNAMNVIRGNASSFVISRVGDYDDLTHVVQGIKSYASGEQVVAALEFMEKIERAAGFPVHTEFLFRKGMIDPTALQIRRFDLKISTQQISDEEYNSADFRTEVALKDGDVVVPLFRVPYSTYIDDDITFIDSPKTLDAIRKIEKENPGGYGLVDGDRITLNTISLPVGEFYVIEPILDLLRRTCTNVKVFINDGEIASRGAHGRMNMASDRTSQFYLSIPHFNTDEGAVAHVRSDGCKGIVNLVDKP